MAGTSGRAFPAAALLASVAAGLLGTTFVASSSAGAKPRLRATSSHASPNGTSSRLGGDASIVGACSVGAVLLALGAAARRSTLTRSAADKADMEVASIPRPEDLLESPKFPLYMGSVGGYFSKATKERHAITWTSKEEYRFEMPTGGWAIMNKGENLCYFRRKEQCICVGKALRKLKIDNYKIYRLKKDGTVQFMHPADGVFPEKVNKGRVATNFRPFSCGSNPQAGAVRFTKYHQKPYEADPLTTLFCKARIMAFNDVENLFPVPNPGPDFYSRGPGVLIDETAELNKALAALPGGKSL